MHSYISKGPSSMDHSLLEIYLRTQSFLKKDLKVIKLLIKSSLQVQLIEDINSWIVYHHPVTAWYLFAILGVTWLIACIYSNHLLQKFSSTLSNVIDICSDFSMAAYVRANSLA